MFTPLRNKVLDFCTQEYSQFYPLCNKTNACQSCLDSYHYEDRAKSYTCMRSCYYYIGRYSARFSLEMSLALNSLSLKSDRQIKVLSLGCGPATELAMLDQLCVSRGFPAFDYTGVDYNTNWIQIQEFQKVRVNPTSTAKFYRADAYTFVKNNDIKQYDIIIFNYFLSDYEKTAGIASVQNLLNLMSYKMKEKSAQDTKPTLILNDIRSKSSYIREAFEKAFQNNFLAQSKERIYYTIRKDNNSDYLQGHGFTKKTDFYLERSMHENQICDACKVAGSMQMVFRGNSL